MRQLVRLLIVALLLPLGACISYTDATPATQPTPVVVQPAPPTGTVVVQPQPN